MKESNNQNRVAEALAKFGEANQSHTVIPIRRYY